ncbi:hypothetical protein Tco_0567809 [Tanacetum coccineum]
MLSRTASNYFFAFSINQLSSSELLKSSWVPVETGKQANKSMMEVPYDKGRASELATRSSQATIIDSAEVGSSKRAAELDHEGSKRQKTNEASGSVQEQPEEEEKELSQEDLQQMMRDDLVMLWNLVKERFSSTEPTHDKERTLWVELNRLFEPNTDDTLWKLQRYMHDPLNGDYMIHVGFIMCLQREE